eukprot:TRINITY_DN15927_c0_g1_i2.p1 TRINITY_DN15927_c0_g1~~TRINITY_DN15927_c0_g1_i2.p1  ORF type:complete len:568 (-),score=26.35 TRINITY_DN15927_c0_g1_i2:38-1510(-)
MWLCYYHVYYSGIYANPNMRPLPWMGETWAALWLNGHYSVDMFLAISGFCITRSILQECARSKKRLNMWRFFCRRALRIWPGLVVVIVVHQLLHIYVVGNPEGDHKCNMTSMVRTLLFVNNFWPWKGMCVEISWSLSVEVQCYVVLALLFWLLCYRPRLQVCACSIFVLTTLIYRMLESANREFRLPPLPSNGFVGDGDGFLDAEGWMDLLYGSSLGRSGVIFIGALCAIAYGKIEHTERLTLKSQCFAYSIMMVSGTLALVQVFTNWYQRLDAPCKVGKDPALYHHSCPQITSIGVGVFVSGIHRLLFAACLSTWLLMWLLLRRVSTAKPEHNYINEVHPADEACVSDTKMKKKDNDCSDDGTDGSKQRFVCLLQMFWKVFTWLLEHPVWYFFAQVSYGIYLFNVYFAVGIHLLVMPKMIPTPGNMMLASCLNVVLSAILGVILHISVEKPFMELRKSRASKPTPTISFGSPDHVTSKAAEAQQTQGLP